MTRLYWVGIKKHDEEGEYTEDHYFYNCHNAAIFANENDIEMFTSGDYPDKLAEELAEDRKEVNE